MLRSVLALFLAAQALAAPTTTTAGESVSTAVKCSTQLGSKSQKKVPTTTSTSHLAAATVVVLSTSKPVTTVQPAPLTSTVILTSSTVETSTAPTATDTFSTTSTEIDTTTQTITSTSLVVALATTSTTITSTSHIPAPDGFEGIEDSSGYTNYGMRRRALDRLAARSNQHSSGPPVKVGAASLKYPQQVFCVKSIQTTYTVKIITVNPTSTVTASPKTSTVISTIISTSTSTVLPSAASTTLSFSTTSTITSQITTVETDTTTSTTTITSQTSTTFYDACAPTNVLGPRISNGQYVYAITAYGNNAPNTGTEVDNTPTGYDCCVACLNYVPRPGSPGGKCQFTNYYTNDAQCYLFSGTSCNNPGYFAGEFEPPMDGYETLAFSNGPCGVLAGAGAGP